MATKKSTAAALEDAAASPAVPALTRQAAAVRMAAALVQSPRFASRITDERQQDLMVALALSLADKLLNVK